MKEKKVDNKDISIITIVKRIVSHFGEGFFETYFSGNEEKLIDFLKSLKTCPLVSR